MSYTLPLHAVAGFPPASPAALSEELAEALEQVMQQDREFLENHPTQDYYIRPITPVEILEAQAMGKQVSEDILMLVGEVAQGCRIRLPFAQDEEPPIEQFQVMQRQIRKGLGTKTPRSKAAAKSQARPKPKGFG